MSEEKSRLFAEQLALIHRHMPTILYGNLIVSVLLCLMLLDTVTAGRLLGWLLAIYVLTLARALYHRHINTVGLGSNLKRRSRQFIFLSLISGLFWGSAGILFFNTNEPAVLAMLVLILAGMVAGSLASSSAYPPIYYSYAVPTVLPFSLLALASSNINVTSIGFLALAFLGFNLVYSVTIYRTILKTLKLRFTNLELIEALQEQKELAENANIAKSKFLAAASHDLRQPLHAQGLFLDSLKSQVTTDKGKQIYQKLMKTRHSLDQLFNGLLDISKLDAGVVDPVYSVVDLRLLLSSLYDEYSPQASDKGLRLSLHLEPVSVNTDRILLERILRNLLSNAIRYTLVGEISIACSERQGKVFLEVSDTGIGVAESELENIFSEYHQLANPERDRNKGLGLGLAIVDRLTRLMDIKLSVKSQQNKGTCFLLELEVAASWEAPLLKPRMQRTAGGDVKVLVIDDEEDIREGMGQMLELWNYRYVLAESADEARAQLLANNVIPDIIIADYRLRENKTGSEAIELITDEFNLDIPGIIITGDTEQERIQQASRSGHRVLHKPVSSSLLWDVINLELSQSALTLADGPGQEVESARMH